MIKVTGLIEQLFTTAVALDQNGGLKNTIYAVDDQIFVMNYDHTVLIRFRLRKSETMFQYPVSFKADDYDSELFEQVGNQIIFHTDSGNYARKKVCGTTDLTPEEVQNLFQHFKSSGGSFETQEKVLTRDFLSLLDDSLSHVELSAEGGRLQIIQRNIYSGGIIEITEKTGGLVDTTTMEHDFGPIGIKTGDLKALFMFQDSLKFNFPVTPTTDFIIIESVDRHRRDMVVILASCLYDEIIEIQTLKTNSDGRQEQKIRRGQPKVD